MDARFHCSLRCVYLGIGRFAVKEIERIGMPLFFRRFLSSLFMRSYFNSGKVSVTPSSPRSMRAAWPTRRK